MRAFWSRNLRQFFRLVPVFALAAVVFFPSVPVVAAGTNDATLTAFLIDRERRRGVDCAGNVMTPPPSLIPSEALNTLAGRAAGHRGVFGPFAESNGLKDIPAFFAVVDGSSPQAAAQALRASWCAELLRPEFTHVGVADIGGSMAIILAGGEPTVVPVYIPPMTPGASGGVPASPDAAVMPAAPAARLGVTPLHEGEESDVAGDTPARTPVPAQALPDIGHKASSLTGPDGRPLPRSYTPPGDDGVIVTPGGAEVPMQAPASQVPAIQAPVAATPAPAQTGAPPTGRPLPPEVGDPSPAAPVPPVYSDNGVKTATDAAGAPGAPGGTVPPASVQAGAEDPEMLRLVNDVRSRGYMCGKTLMPSVPPLKNNPVVARSATRHAADMLLRNYFSPVTPEGVRAGGRLTEAGYAWAVLAENIASGTPTAESALKSWLNHEGQCRNIMSRDYTEAGAGAAGSIRVLTLTAPLSGGGAPAE